MHVFIVSPATPYIVRRGTVQVFFVFVLYHQRVSTLKTVLTDRQPREIKLPEELLFVFFIIVLMFGLL